MFLGSQAGCPKGVDISQATVSWLCTNLVDEPEEDIVDRAPDKRPVGHELAVDPVQNRLDSDITSNLSKNRAGNHQQSVIEPQAICQNRARNRIACAVTLI